MSPESVLPHTSTNSLLILDGAEDGSPFQQIFGEVMQPQDEKEQEAVVIDDESFDVVNFGPEEQYEDLISKEGEAQVQEDDQWSRQQQQ